MDDSEINRMYMEMILRHCGHKCDFAENGIIALEKLDSQSDYQIIFMDCRMPRMNGFDTIKEIRK